jgi:hypothetical protein
MKPAWRIPFLFARNAHFAISKTAAFEFSRYRVEMKLSDIAPKLSSTYREYKL